MPPGEFNKVIRIQADRLAAEIGLPPNTFFEISELEQIATSAYGIELEIKGVKFTTSASKKALADILLVKIEKSKRPRR